MVLNVTSVNKSFGKEQVLKDINLSMNSGEIVSLIGPNGSGKTTLMKIIVNLCFPNSGSVDICGTDLFKDTEKALSMVSSLIENPSFFRQFTGKQHLEMVAYLRGKSKSKVDKYIEISELGKNINKYPHKYSLGMKQKLYVSMCLLAEPKLLILDEPTNGLDYDSVLSFIDIMRETKAKDTSVLISSHRLNELQKISDRFIFLKKGEIVANVEKSDDIDLEKLYVDLFRGKKDEDTEN